MICPECNHEVQDSLSICPYCGFDLGLYTKTFDTIYSKKLNHLNQENNSQTAYSNVSMPSGPRCPYCGSTNLTRITSVDKVVNIALFGLFGNKRRYQWHCNGCKTDF